MTADSQHSTIRALLGAALSAGLAILIGSCGGGAAAVIAALGNSGGAAVPLVLFPGDERPKPAVILPFTAEVRAIAATPDGKKLYAADTLHNTVSVIDTATRRTIKVIDVGTGPRFLAVTPDGTRVLVANYGRLNPDFDHQTEGAGSTVSVIDTTTDSVVAEIEVGQRPFAIAFTSGGNGGKAYVANYDCESPCGTAASPGTVSVIDMARLDTPAVPIQLAHGGAQGSAPMAIAVVGNAHRAFVVNRESNNVAVIDTTNNQVVGMIDVGQRPSGITMSPKQDKVFVTNSEDNNVVFIDVSSASIEGSPVSVGQGPMGIVVDKEGKYLFVANAWRIDEQDACAPQTSSPEPRFGRTVSVIDIAAKNTVGAEIDVGQAPLAIAITGKGDKVYTMSACADQTTRKGEVSSIATADATHSGTVVPTTIQVAARGTAMVIAGEDSEERVYVAHPHAVSVINTTTDEVVGAPIPVRGDGPTKLAFSSDGDKLYAIRPGTDSVVVVDVDAQNNTEQVLGVLSVGSGPSDIAVTHGRTGGDVVLVTNAGFSRTPDKRLSVIDVRPPGETGSVVATVELVDATNDPAEALGPIAVALTADQSSAVVANFGDFFPNNRVRGEYISIVDVDSVLTPSPSVFNVAGLGDFATDVVTRPDVSDEFLSAGFFSDNVSRATTTGQDLGDLDTSINGPTDVAIAPQLAGGTLAIVANYDVLDLLGNPAPNVTQVNPTDIAFIEPTSETADCTDLELNCERTNPARLAATPDGGRVFVLNSGDRSYICDATLGTFCETGHTVTIFDLPLPDSSTQPTGMVVDVGHRPTDIAFVDGTIRRAYVSNYFDDTVSVIDTWDAAPSNVTVHTLDSGRGPSGIAVHPTGQTVYVADSISNTITVLNVGDAGVPSAVARTINLPD